MRILIAEDDAVSRLVLSKTLTSEGHQITLVPNGRVAWETYQRDAWPVVITDWEMPELDGVGLARRIRAQRSRTYCWIILLTSRAFHQNYSETMKAGVDDYLTKPLDRDLLLARLEVARRVIDMNGQLALLQAAIPICMGCKAMRDTTAQWQRVDQYLHDHAGMDFSHGLCPECYFASSVLPDLTRLRARRSAPRGAPAEGLAGLRRFEREESPGLEEDLRTYVAFAMERLASSLAGGQRLPPAQ